MKTSVELNDDKLALARKLGKATTLKQLIDQALDAYIQQMRRRSMAELLGSDFFEGDLNTMRERSRGRPRR